MFAQNSLNRITDWKMWPLVKHQLWITPLSLFVLLGAGLILNDISFAALIVICIFGLPYILFTQELNNPEGKMIFYALMPILIANQFVLTGGSMETFFILLFMGILALLTFTANLSLKTNLAGIFFSYCVQLFITLGVFFYLFPES